MLEDFKVWKTQFGRSLGVSGIVLRGWSFAPERMELVGRMPQVSMMRSGELDRGWADWLAFVFPEDRESVDARFKQILSQAGGYELEYRLDGERPVVVREQGMVYLGAKGDLRSVVSIIRDISLERDLETRLGHARKMESFGKLAGGVAHDFNNMLAVILGYSQMVLDELEAGDPRLAFVQEIEGAAQRAASLTNQLLAFTRQEVEATKVLAFDGVLTEMGKMLRRMSGERILFSTVAGTGENALLRVDRNQIEQLLIHLSVCARDLLPEGGFFSLATSAVKPEQHKPKDPTTKSPHGWLRLVAECHAMRADRDLNEKGDEVGWSGELSALSTCESIVRDNHGEMYPEGIPGVSAGLVLCFPLAKAMTEAETEEQKQENQAPAQDAPKLVLLVEDEPGVRKLTKLIITRLGYQVIDAENGSAGWFEFEENKSKGIAMVVTDMIMPATGGLELGQKILARNPSIPILFLSGYANQPKVLADAQLRANYAFLRKPFTVDEFSTKFKDLLAAGK